MGKKKKDGGLTRNQQRKLNYSTMGKDPSHTARNKQIETMLSEGAIRQEQEELEAIEKTKEEKRQKKLAAKGVSNDKATLGRTEASSQPSDAI